MASRSPVIVASPKAFSKESGRMRPRTISRGRGRAARRVPGDPRSGSGSGAQGGSPAVPEERGFPGEVEEGHRIPVSGTAFFADAEPAGIAKGMSGEVARGAGKRAAAREFRLMKQASPQVDACRREEQIHRQIRPRESGRNRHGTRARRNRSGRPRAGAGGHQGCRCRAEGRREVPVQFRGEGITVF